MYVKVHRAVRFLRTALLHSITSRRPCGAFHRKRNRTRNRVLFLFLRYCLEWQCPEQPAQPPPQLPPQVLFPCFFWRMRYRIMEMTTAKRTAEMSMVARLALNHVSMENHSFGKEWK